MNCTRLPLPPPWSHPETNNALELKKVSINVNIIQKFNDRGMSIVVCTLLSGYLIVLFIFYIFVVDMNFDIDINDVLWKDV